MKNEDSPDYISDLEAVEISLEMFTKLLDTGQAKVHPEAIFFKQTLQQIALLKSQLNLSRSFSAKAYVALRDVIAGGCRDWPQQIELLDVIYLNGLLAEYEASFQSKSEDPS